MGCVQQQPQIMMTFDDDSNEVTVSKDTNNNDHREYMDINQNIFNEYKEKERQIKQQTEVNTISLNQITLRVTNEISMLLHRNALQRNRLGSWWYSAIKNHKYWGIAMWNQREICILYDDEVEPQEEIVHKIELISGSFVCQHTHISSKNCLFDRAVFYQN